MSIKGTRRAKILIWAFLTISLIACAETGDPRANVYYANDRASDQDSDSSTDADSASVIDTDINRDGDSSESHTDEDVDNYMSSDSDTGGDTDSVDSNFTTDTIEGKDTLEDADTDTNTAVEDPSSTDICASFNLFIEAKPVKMMILQDISASMQDKDKWGQAQAALASLLSEYENDIQFGFDAFPNFSTCGVSDPVYMDSALYNAESIVDLFPSIRLTLGTPLYKAMLNFTDETYAPDFMSPGMDKYLLVVSDGGDTCYTDEEMGLFSAATPAQLTELTQRLRDTFDIQTFVIGFGLGTRLNEDGESLTAIARAGGMLDDYIEVQDEQELSAALSDIGASVVSCAYEIGEQDQDKVDLDLVNVYFNGTETVPRDDGCNSGQGWTWTDDSRTAIELCDAACYALQSGEVTDVSIKIMCSIVDIVVI